MNFNFFFAIYNFTFYLMNRRYESMKYNMKYAFEVEPLSFWNTPKIIQVSTSNIIIVKKNREIQKIYNLIYFPAQMSLCYNAYIYFILLSYTKNKTFIFVSYHI